MHVTLQPVETHPCADILFIVQKYDDELAYVLRLVQPRSNLSEGIPEESLVGDRKRRQTGVATAHQLHPSS